MPKVPAVAYIRVSTTEQLKGFGLEVQEKAIPRLLRVRGMKLVGVFRDEGQSGSNGLESRVGLAEALAMLKEHDSTQLVVYRLDRLGTGHDSSGDPCREASK